MAQLFAAIEMEITEQKLHHRLWLPPWALAVILKRKILIDVLCQGSLFSVLLSWLLR
jgi:hypothetical protein